MNALLLPQLVLFKTEAGVSTRHFSELGMPTGGFSHSLLLLTSTSARLFPVEHQVYVRSSSHCRPSLLPDVHMLLFVVPAICVRVINL